MKLTILGSGTAAPRISRNMSGYLLESSGKKILFDSGAGTIRQLLKLKADLIDIGHIFYTHLHNDHISDLGAIIWSNNYGILRDKELNLYGPKGFKAYYKILMKKILKPKKLNYNINVVEMKSSSMVKIPIGNNPSDKNPIASKRDYDGRDNSNNFITIKSIKSMHTDSSVSYRIERGNASIVYSGDTDYSNEIIEISRNADLLILECSFPYKAEGHLTPSLCGEIAAKANAKRLVLTHFYPECDLVDVKKQCAAEFNGEIILASDFMEIKV